MRILPLLLLLFVEADAYSFVLEYGGLHLVFYCPHGSDHVGQLV